MSIEDFPNPLEHETQGIEGANSFDDLFTKIRNIGEIQGTRKMYTPNEIIKIIERVRHGHRPIEFVTRSHGIKDTVRRLLETDKVHSKYTEGSRKKN